MSSLFFLDDNGDNKTLSVLNAIDEGYEKRNPKNSANTNKPFIVKSIKTKTEETKNAYPNPRQHAVEFIEYLRNEKKLGTTSWHSMMTDIIKKHSELIDKDSLPRAGNSFNV